MTAIRIWLRAVLRQRWRATIVLSLLVATATAAAIGAADGARRTQTAYPRMRIATRASDLLLSVYGDGVSRYYDAVGKLPEVERYGKAAGVPIIGSKVNGAPDPLLQTNSLAAEDDHTFRTIARPKLLQGRLFNAAAPDEIMMNPLAAKTLHLSVGSRFHAFIADEDNTADAAKATPVGDLRVVGIVVGVDDVVPTTFLDAAGQVYLTHAFILAHPVVAARENLNYDGTFIQLKPGTNQLAFVKKANDLVQHFPEAGGGTFVQDEATAGNRVGRAIEPLAIALYVFAGLVAVAMLFVLGQAIARQQFVEAAEYETLRALGLTRSQIVAMSLLRVLIIAGGGALIGAGLSLAVSPFMPIGPARIAEPKPGFEVNLPIVVLGAALIVVMLVARALLPALRASSAGAGAFGAGRRSVLAEAAARVGAAPTTASGIRMAFEQKRGAASLPLRSALAGSVVGLAALVAALMFGSTLNRLVSDPHQYGWRWDLIADSSFGAFPDKTIGKQLLENPDVSGLTFGNYGDAVIAGRDVPGIGLDQKKGAVYPVLVEGRAATNDDEIVLGTTVMHLAHTSVGKTIEVNIAEEKHSMRVVGRAVFPTMGRGSFEPTALGDGVAVVAELFKQFQDPQFKGAIYNFALIKVRPGSSGSVTKLLNDKFLVGDCVLTNDCVVGSAGPGRGRPIELGVLADVRSAPLILAGLLALFATATLAHSLLTSVRMRAHDLAILKTIGFVKRQIRATVAWQTSALAFTALVVGLPLGVVAGRAIWSRFADGLGVTPGAVVPIIVVLVAIPATLLIANLIGALPARVAARTEAAVVLRTE
jgi:hypothetical protein